MITIYYKLIGYANICSCVQDHRLKVISLNTRYCFWKIKWEQWNLQRKLMLQVWVWKPSEADCQSLKTPRHWSSSEFEVKKLKVNLFGYLKTQVCRRNGSMKQQLF